jgi:hypothetical protein
MIRNAVWRTRSRRLGGFLTAISAATLVLTGCGSSNDDNHPAANSVLLLAGPTADMTVRIPQGWHQVINTGNPVIAEMVYPTTCIGREEVSCALGLARIASAISPTMDAAVTQVEQAVLGVPGVIPGPDISKGPAKVGDRDGFAHRFMFKNANANFTAVIGAVPSGPLVADAKGNHEYSLVLAWVTDKPGTPGVKALDEIVASAQVYGGQQPTGPAGS